MRVAQREKASNQAINGLGSIAYWHRNKYTLIPGFYSVHNCQIYRAKETSRFCRASGEVRHSHQRCCCHRRSVRSKGFPPRTRPMVTCKRLQS
jgi:hypothetical protein